MSDALIQIVDKTGKPVGSASIDDAQKNGLIHTIARVMVEDGNGNVLLQKRAASMSVYPNCWDNSAAGHVDEGETDEFAAARELAEEVGIENVRLQEIGTYFTDTKYNNERILKRFNKVYKAVASKSTKLTLQQDEVSDAKWFAIDEVKSLIKGHPDHVTDGLIDVFERYY